MVDAESDDSSLVSFLMIGQVVTMLDSMRSGDRRHWRISRTLTTA